ncbi:hypothetical protein NYE70_03275 [Paenibacillus sp. FSL R5-0407]|uniref:hypothetical protein n=1 Tax=Paenibacillus sp. FSL R5-0407 TaxID=2975320 RepID=UPI0030FC797C
MRVACANDSYGIFKTRAGQGSQVALADSSSGKILILLTSIIVGILIMFSPVFITGSYYDVNKVMGNILSAEMVVRTLAVVIKLLTMYDGVKTFFKK